VKTYCFLDLKVNKDYASKDLRGFGTIHTMERLKERAKGHNVEFITFDEKVRTVSQATELLDISSSEIIKSLVVMGDEPIVCIVPGNKSVSFKKLRKLYDHVRMATEEEVCEITGYKVGGVPPLVDTKVLVDKRVMAHEYVYGGGGNDHTLVKITPHDIVTLNDCIEIVNIAK
jgi:prolyl-tRNA editing enzyme YbaK/EbsC (Cys-tRNA(Pro) deacylase)